MHEPLPIPGRNRTLPLALVVAVLAAATILFGVLFVLADGETERLDRELAGTERELADQDARIGTARSAVADLDAEHTDLAAEVVTLRACAGPAERTVRAARTRDDAALDAAVDQLLTNCRR
ncbi:hypothetical protein [Actinophytocola gossypii]|uniref:Uncharacterized protein n=1 Tax=Actinophytocola gossypii TaxID=2812003 RepID=A0ABT2J6Y6_9PSEU|nr:hypothetical protein [Actinophytocola gossypii]MCT2583451.1 hypothetical protein [Actinophytocola gossypii]